jgi:Fe2+ transport system protein FeoA
MNVPAAAAAASNPAPLALTAVRAGQWVKVAALGECHGAAARLAHLGVMVGYPVRMVRPSRRGPVLIEVKGSRFALGHSLARAIRVRLIEPADRAAEDPVAIPAE